MQAALDRAGLGGPARLQLLERAFPIPMASVECMLTQRVHLSGIFGVCKGHQGQRVVTDQPPP
jgi:hypothetical protein